MTIRILLSSSPCRFQRRNVVRFSNASDGGGTAGAGVGVSFFCVADCSDYLRRHAPSNRTSKYRSRRNFSSSSSSPSLTDVLNESVRLGRLQPDPIQQGAVKKLTRLQEALKVYEHQAWIQYLEQYKTYQNQQEKLEQQQQQAKEGERMNDKKDEKDSFHPKEDEQSSPPTTTLVEPERPNIAIPRGIYLHGSVGVGKSMLMDLFFEHAVLLPSSNSSSSSNNNNNNKRRVHFHEFLHEIHQRIHRLKQEDLKTKGRSFHIDVCVQHNPIVRIAQQVASETTLLCLDEFQVTDVADAMILSQLFSTLWQHGVVLVATSNRPPQDLYEDGINRGYFLPFIGLLEHHCVIHHLEESSKGDYRKLLATNLEDYYLPIGNDFTKEESNDNNDTISSSSIIDDTFHKLLDGQEPASIELDVGFGRSITVPTAHPDGHLAARFQCDDLCLAEYGAAEYRAIANRFSIIVLENIRQFKLRSQHDAARRFVTLMDELYEHKCALLCTASHPPYELFVLEPKNDEANNNRRLHENEDSDINNDAQEKGMNSADDKVSEVFGVDVAQARTSRTSVGELASVRELASFAFPRATSRIVEMCSHRWWETHQPN